MHSLRRRKQSKKKKSKFQKLWDKADRLKQRNQRFREDFEDFANQLYGRLVNVSAEMARSMQPLLENLLRLGQRKSLANWQRDELDLWVEELLSTISSAGPVDPDLLDQVAHYDAWRMGLSLDDPDVPAAKQLLGIIESAREEQRRAAADAAEIDREIERAFAREKVEVELDRQFGRQPPQSRRTDAKIDDMWTDDLADAQQQVERQWREAREAARERLIEKRYAEIDRRIAERVSADSNLDDWDPWAELDALLGEAAPGEEDFDNELPDEDSDIGAALSDTTIQRLFRRAAQVLHPDREPDPDKRAAKSAVMRDLLAARRTGDVMAVIDICRLYVSDDAALSSAGEKQLIAALEGQITRLEDERHRIIEQSDHHVRVYDDFWHSSATERKQRVAQFAEYIETEKREYQNLARQIVSLAKLKPYLAARYDQRADSMIAARFKYGFDAEVH